MKRTYIGLLVGLALVTGCSTAIGHKDPVSVPAAPAGAERPPGVSGVAQTPADVPRPVSPYEQAQVHLKAEDFETAVRVLEAVVSADPEDARAWNDLCFAYIRLQWWPEAKRAGEAALRLDPHNAAAAFNVGRAYLGAKEYHEASIYLNRAFEQNPTNADVAWFLGQAYEGDEKPLSALETYRDALAASPGDQEMQGALQRLQAELEAGKTFLLRADLTGDGRQSEVWTRPGQLRVLDPAGTELLSLELTAGNPLFEAEAVDLGVSLPVLWVRIAPGCPGGPEHALYAFDKASGLMKELVWHGCATVVDFDKETHSVSFATRVMPSYVTTTYTFDGTNLVEEGSTESLAFVWPTNVDLALEKILGQGDDEGIFRDQAVADAFIAAWSGNDTRVTVTGPEASGGKFTGEVTITQGARTARGTIHMVEVDEKWHVDRLDLALPAR